MEMHHFYATTRGIDHGHVVGVERRLAPWHIEQHVEERGGVARWHLISDVESEREMAEHLRQAVKRETGRDLVRRSAPPTA